MEYAIGVDIGGTKIAVAVVGQSGEIASKTAFPMDHAKSPDQVIDEIIQAIKHVVEGQIRKEQNILGIGVGAPGPLDTWTGVIHRPPNLPSWIDVPIKGKLAAAFAVPVLIENDANAAALAEKWIGAGKGSENFTYLTISTGIGAGIIANGQLLSGSRGNAGEIGHTVIDPGYGRCSCGQIGCLDLIASGRAIAKNGSEIMGEELSTKAVFDLYGKGHKGLDEYIDHVFWALGASSVSLVNILDTEKIIVGGGVSQIGEPLFQRMEAYIRIHALNPAGRSTKVVPAELNEHAGVIGAAALCFSSLVLETNK